VVLETYSVRGRPIGITRYKYLPSTQETSFYFSDGKPGIATVGPCLGAHRIVTKFDASDHPIDVEFYELDGGRKQSRHYKYADGQIVEMNVSAYSDSRFVYTYAMDADANWTKQAIDKFDSKNRTTEPDYKRTVSRRIEYFR
jgi:hypothetical protein